MKSTAKQCDTAMSILQWKIPYPFNRIQQNYGYYFLNVIKSQLLILASSCGLQSMNQEGILQRLNKAVKLFRG